MTDQQIDPPGAATASGDGASYAGVVYDLDGTLVDLAVDWAAVERELHALLVEAGVDPDGLVTWELLEAAEDAGVGEAAEDLISEHECAGAERARRLPHADELGDGTLPAAVCSLNCERACRIALDREGLLARVRDVVGRDSLAGRERKPDPEPLLRAVESLGLEPHEVVFVGDAERDAETARRAGTGFRYV
ncbi:HAD family hydrolase [Halarchaeum sp. CBA1220]|uniref:HAD family hydrolase n=1 Tax=Halarchaeum sp. CBA1220 TaxID=1853682 RepID=UPI00267C0ECA